VRFTVYKSSRIASAGIHRATIEDAVDSALQLMRDGSLVKIEDHETGKVYRDSDIPALQKMLNA
jgi:UDP-N-acetylenolpyruvoylglucosamine reductase